MYIKSKSSIHFCWFWVLWSKIVRNNPVGYIVAYKLHFKNAKLFLFSLGVYIPGKSKHIQVSFSKSFYESFDYIQCLKKKLEQKYIRNHCRRDLCFFLIVCHSSGNNCPEILVTMEFCLSWLLCMHNFLCIIYLLLLTNGKLDYCHYAIIIG